MGQGPHKPRALGSIVPALARNARTGHPPKIPAQPHRQKRTRRELWR